MRRNFLSADVKIFYPRSRPFMRMCIWKTDGKRQQQITLKRFWACSRLAQVLSRCERALQRSHGDDVPFSQTSELLWVAILHSHGKS